MALLPPVSSAENFHLHAFFDLVLFNWKLYFCHSCMCRDGLKLTKSPRTIFHFVMGSGSFRLCPFMCLRRAAAAVHGRQDIVLLVSFPGRVRERDLHHHSSLIASFPGSHAREREIEVVRYIFAFQESLGTRLVA